jgi:hypothetical protein
MANKMSDDYCHYCHRAIDKRLEEERRKVDELLRKAREIVD